MIPRKLTDILQELQLEARQATWQVHGQTVVTHKALEQVAAHKGIMFDPPQIIESDPEKRICVMIVTGRLKDKHEWSIGEAMPINIDKKNNQQQYPYAMAEKRAKDRVILKLIEVAGFVYSETESEAFKERSNAGEVFKEPSNATMRDKDKWRLELARELEELDRKPKLDQQWQDWIEEIKTKISQATETWQIRKLGEQQSNKMTALRQHNSEWADKLIEYISVRFKQLNEGERFNAPF
jgi:hypothetical protein